MDEKYTTPEAAMRQLLEVAVSSGRSWQSPQTGYVHYHYTLNDEGIHHTIPLYENILFALALMRSFSGGNFSEGKKLLERLLDFQSQHSYESRGNFPIYIHEYPSCHSFHSGAHILPALYWIYKDFRHFLGKELEKKVAEALYELASHNLKIFKEYSPPPSHIEWKIAAGLQVVGELLEEDKFKEEGALMLETLQQTKNCNLLRSPTEIADLLIAFQMIYPSIEEGVGKEFWQLIAATWHFPTGSYCGPGWKESQNGSEPQVTLYDYFMGVFSRKYGYRVFADHPIQLQAALVRLSEDEIVEPAYPLELQGAIREMPWKLHQTERFAWSFIGMRKGSHSEDKTFIPFKLLWGNATRTHSLVCQGGYIDTIEFVAEKNQIVMDVLLKASVPEAYWRERQELSFYFDNSPWIQTTIQGATATTFNFGDDIAIGDNDLKMHMKIEKVEGEGRFQGHFTKGNRPSQTALIGAKRFDVHDWHIFIRTIDRTLDCRFRVTMTLEA